MTDCGAGINSPIAKIYSKRTRFYLLTLQLILLCLPLLQFFAIKTDNGNIPASACYFFSLLFAPYLLVNLENLRLPPWYITFLCAYVLIFAIIRMPRYGLSKNILHWAFGFYLLVVLLNVGTDFEKEEWLRLLEIGACTFGVLHLLYMSLHFETVWFLLRGFFDGTVPGRYAALLPSLTRGGRNLDCTWLGLGAFFVRGREKAVYVTYAIFFSFLGCSRVGVISIGLAVLWSLIYDPVYRLTWKNLKLYVAGGFAVLLVLFGTGTAQAFLGRNLISLPAPAVWFDLAPEKTVEPIASAEPMSQQTAMAPVDPTLQNASATAKFLSGRAAMWKIAPRMFRDNPFGCGVGNTMRVMRTNYGFTSGEDVIHNVFFQWSLDEGFIGGIWFLGLLAAFLYGQWKKRLRCFADPFAGYFLTYFVLSLVQFHGAEALMIFVLGAWMSTEKQSIVCKDVFCKLRPAELR